MNKVDHILRLCEDLNDIFKVGLREKERECALVMLKTLLGRVQRMKKAS